ncbi:MAG TPA: ABC transporter permease [Gemmatimonadaceae bacterium]|nr:ABC transporter permease [Gemmatimonadaceae bacterium]
MIPIRALHRKLVRDLLRLRGQVISIGVVVACGIMTVVAMRGTYTALASSRDAFYDRQRFADVWVNVVRAPEAVARRVADLPGVSAVRTRIVTDVALDVPWLVEPARGRLVSIPDRGEADLNRLYLASGRLPEPGRTDEVVASERFATTNGIQLGDSIGAVIAQRWQRLRIVGVGVAPDYLFEIAPGDLFPDNERFGILWMRRGVLGPAAGMEGAFNELVLSLAPGASRDDVFAAVDRILAPYGGLGAYGRENQFSNRILDSELQQNRVTATVVPAIFLAVAAFLLNIVLARLISTQRDEIAALKAFGYTNREVGLHFLGFAMGAVFVGVALGTGIGVVLGRMFVDLYGQFFRFPDLAFRMDFPTAALAIGIATAAAVIGSLGAVRRAIALPPAEAMRPEAPAVFRHGILERITLAHIASPVFRMILRNLERRPARSIMSVVGVSFAVGILIVGRFFFDSAGFMGDYQYRELQREDVTVLFEAPRAAAVRHDLARLPNVTRVETFRSVPVRLHANHLNRQLALTGVDPDARLRRILGQGGREVVLPGEGVVLTLALAEALGVRAGDSVLVEVLEGARQRRVLPVGGTVDELLGLSAYMDARALARWLGETPTVSGAYLRVAGDPAPVHAELGDMPIVAGVTTRMTMLQNFERQLADNLMVSATIFAILAAAIAVGVLYNGARISLSERGRDLASLRVLGFTRGEVGVMLLGEQAIVTLAGIPVGWLIGYGLSAMMVRALATDLYRFPLILTPMSYAYAAGIVMIAAAVAGLLVRRRLNRLDLVAVLKTRE